MKLEEQISKVLEQLCEEAISNHEKHDLSNAVGEVKIKGVTYQIQLQFIANTKMWQAEKGVRHQEVVKIHE